MPFFVVTTRSTFENKYIVEAYSQTEAEQIVAEGQVDFFQKHIGEPVKRVKKIKDNRKMTKKTLREKTRDKLRKKGYW